MRKLLSRGDRVKVGYAAGGSVANLPYGFVNAINETDVTSSRYVWLNEDGEAAMTPMQRGGALALRASRLIEASPLSRVVRTH